MVKTKILNSKEKFLKDVIAFSNSSGGKIMLGIEDDGTVYGVLGVEMLTEYLNIQMPYEELQNQSAGTYMLAYTKSTLKDEEIVLENICGVSSKSGCMEQELESEKLKLQKNSYGDYLLKLNGKKYYATLKPLQLYSRNAPFFDEQWVLIGTVEM